MLSRLACTKSFINPTILKSAIQNVPRRQQIFRTFAEETKFKTRSERISDKLTLKERAMAPPGKYSRFVSLNCNKIFFQRKKCFCNRQRSFDGWICFGSWSFVFLRIGTWIWHKHAAELTVRKLIIIFHNSHEISQTCF